MKILLTLVLGIAVLAALGDIASAESPKSSITGVVSSIDKNATVEGSPATTFILAAEGKQYTFILPKGKERPEVGAIVVVHYVGNLNTTDIWPATDVEKKEKKVHK